MVAPGQPATTSEPSADWTVQVADTIDSVVATVRDKTSVPLETIARGLVYGIIVAVMGVTALVLVVVAAVRGLVILVDEVLSFGDVWLPYLVVGATFTLGGMFLWSKRRPTGQS